ncbi:MAG TPA: hypothetical protein PKD09_18460 [Aggregatilinea sp.]|uniref:hypothetical protein n=1 Tax=Aggregatilinea sp. TaxID=2806333 RepID=UPI002C1828F7|nr:hypothetical protein [Aggregatilinea sp.]HML23645.1 hypothetical protein [Aggregatilinea sp.]
MLGKLLHRYRIEIKYILLTLALLVVLGWLASRNVFDPIEGKVNEGMDFLSEYGLVGMFIIGLLSNTTLVIIVPYTLPMLPLVVYMTSPVDVIALGVATGIGSGLGEALSYAIAHTIVSHVDDLEKSALFRWTHDSISRRPHVIPLLLWFVSAVPIPDLAVIVPLAMVKYPWQKIVLPMVTGKIVQNTAVALAFKYAADRAEGLVSRDINFDITAIIAVLFIMVVAYQIESSRGKDTQPAALTPGEETSGDR